MIPNLAESLELFLPTFTGTIFPWVALCTIISLIGIGVAKIYHWFKGHIVG